MHSMTVTHSCSSEGCIGYLHSAHLGANLVSCWVLTGANQSRGRQQQGERGNGKERPARERAERGNQKAAELVTCSLSNSQLLFLLLLGPAPDTFRKENNSGQGEQGQRDLFILLFIR